MLWQAAYSELFFEDILFPDLDSSKLNEILIEYQKRTRSFGK
jgi:undecaprenyl diphosphate synthase